MVINRLTPDQRRWFNAIRASLTRDLLIPAWLEEVPVGSQRVCGHCYIATEAALYAFGRKAGFATFVARIEGGGTHWWLAHPETGAIIDLTYEQTQKHFPYSITGRRQAMRRGKGPGGISMRGAKLLKRARKVLDKH